MSKYERIDCGFYDHFEIYASRKTWASIALTDGSELNTRIVTLRTHEKEEFAELLSGREIRLDKVATLASLKAKSPAFWRVLDMIDYDLWANQVVFRQLSERPMLDDVISRMSHIINAQNIWLDRINKREGKSDVWETIDPHTWSTICKERHKELCSTLEESELNAEVVYQNLSGVNQLSELGDILHHLVNHGSYHRGQIMEMIRTAGYPTAPTDYVYYVKGRPL